MFRVESSSPEATARIARLLGQRAPKGLVIGLVGDLGAGKTLFVQSFSRALGVTGLPQKVFLIEAAEVTSPSFSLMNLYEGDCPIAHFDFYRLEREEELEDIGFYEYADAPEGIVLVEWSDKFPDAMPEDYIEVAITRGDGAQRTLAFHAVGARYASFLKEWKDFVDTCD